MSFKVSPDAYFGEREFSEELQHCTQDYWIYVCPSVIVKTSGDYFVFQFMEKEHVIRRTADQQLQGFYNYCKHRGHKIYHQRVGSGDIRCSYHGWLYDDDNKLSKLPWNDKCYHIKTEEISLDRDFSLMEKFGHVWIYLGNKKLEDVKFPADQIARQLEAFERELGNSYAVVVSRQKFNWRLIFDNLYDRVHPGFLHAKSLARIVSLDFDSYPDDFSIAEDKRDVLANVAQTGKRRDSNVSVNFMQTSEFEAGAYVNGHIYPYLHFFTPDGGRVFCYESYLPVSSTETDANIFWVISKNIGKAAATSIMQGFIYGGAVVLKEDWDVVSSITAVVNKPTHYNYGAHEKNAVIMTKINEK